MPAGQVRLLVGDQGGAAAVVQAVEQPAGDDDAAWPAGQRVRLDGRAGHHDDAVLGVQPGGTPVGLGQGPRPVADHDRDRDGGPGQRQRGGHPGGRGNRGTAPHDLL